MNSPTITKEALPVGLSKCPALIRAGGPEVIRKYIEFFTARVSNQTTRITYHTSIAEFFAWVSARKLGPCLENIETIIVAAYCHQQLQTKALITVRKDLAALRVFFGYLVEQQILKTNPAREVRLNRHSQDTGATPVIPYVTMQLFFDSIDTSTITGLRDKAIIGTMYYTMARVSAVSTIRVKDYVIADPDRYLVLHEKGGKERKIRVANKLQGLLDAYIAAAQISQDKEGWLFRAFEWHPGRKLKEQQLHRKGIWQMVQRRWVKLRLDYEITCHSFRASSITHHLTMGGKLETVQNMAGHASIHTTRLYDRRSRETPQNEWDRI